MVRFAVLISSICSIIVLTFILTRWYSPVNCINSSIVEKVFIQGSESTVRSCDPIVRLFDSAPDVVAQDSWLLQRIESLDRVAQYLDLTSGPLTLVIRGNDSHEIVLEPNFVSMSVASLHRYGILERALLYAKLNISSPMAAEVVADFLWEEFIVEEAESPARPWLSYIHNLKTYCQTDHVMLMHQGYCSTQNSLRDSYISDPREDLVSWSLKPLYVKTLREIYKQSSMSEKLSLLRNLIFLGAPDDSALGRRWYTKSLTSQEDSFHVMMTNWLMPLDVGPKVAQLAIRSFLTIQHQKMTFVEVDSSSAGVFPLLVVREIEDKGAEPFLIERSGVVSMHPGSARLGVSRGELFQQLPIRQVIYVSCQVPSPKDVLRYDQLAARVLYVRHCSPEDVDWSEVAAVGLAQYLKTHPRVQFIEFNVSAVKLAQRVHGSLRGDVDFAAWKKWLMWNRSVKESEPSVQRPLSAIEGVRRYRVF
jgi:hypothetical protein